MTRSQLFDELLSSAETLTDDGISKELSTILPPTELAGLALRIRTSIAPASQR